MGGSPRTIAAVTLYFSLLGLGFGQAVPAPKEILSVDWHGRFSPWEAAKPHLPSAKPEDYRLTVSNAGEVRYRVSAWRRCSKDELKSCVPDWWMLWDDSHEQVFTGELDAAEMERLRMLLNRLDLRFFDGEALANAGPSVGDFMLSIDGARGHHFLMFLGFMPAHYRDQSQPAPLVDLFCEARTIAKKISKSGDLPEWCSTKPAR